VVTTERFNILRSLDVYPDWTVAVISEILQVEMLVVWPPINVVRTEGPPFRSNSHLCFFRYINSIMRTCPFSFSGLLTNEESPARRAGDELENSQARWSGIYFLFESLKWIEFENDMACRFRRKHAWVEAKKEF
jgi:hypothetical protein